MFFSALSKLGYNGATSRLGNLDATSARGAALQQGRRPHFFFRTAQEAATQEGALALPPARPPVPVHRRRRAPHRPKVEAAPAETAHGSLGAELKLLRAARAALNRGEAGAAFAGVQEHASQHPRGHLTEEREALAVQSLSALGRKEAAWARARRFEDRYPRSMMLPAVRAAVGQATP